MNYKTISINNTSNLNILKILLIMVTFQMRRRTTINHELNKISARQSFHPSLIILGAIKI